MQVSLSLGPLISALAGGNTSVIKPSELCPAVATTLAAIIPKYFETEVCAVVNGAIPETTALMTLPWDLVFFTGSERVGNIIAAAAAKTTSPVVLELGGKAPVVVTEDCPCVASMCDRIIWGKTVNCGQTCVAPDYLLVHKSRINEVMQGMRASLHSMFGEDQHASGEFGRVVTSGHTSRLKDMLEEAEDAGCQIVTGGSNLVDVQEKFFPTTIIRVETEKHAQLRIMNEV